MHRWPEPVETVAAYLRASGSEARLEELPAEAPDARTAADAIGCALEQVVVTRLLVAGRDTATALLPGDRPLDHAKAARVLGVPRTRDAYDDEIAARTGFAASSVPPFPTALTETVLVERLLLALPVVWASAGSPRHVVMLAPAELLRLARGSAVDVAGDSA